jgi:tRNA(adenine34) deaminase
MPGSIDNEFMARALALARVAKDHDEVPVGAIVVSGSTIVGEGWNQPIAANDPTAHAEIIALRAAGSAKLSYRLNRCIVYVTLEPCVMCMGAILHARISRLVFGAWDSKAGACGSVLDLPREPRLKLSIDVFGGVRAEESRKLLQEFFEARR